MLSVALGFIYTISLQQRHIQNIWLGDCTIFFIIINAKDNHFGFVVIIFWINLFIFLELEKNVGFMSYLMNCVSHFNGIASYTQISVNVSSVMLYQDVGPNILLV